MIILDRYWIIHDRASPMYTSLQLASYTELYKDRDLIFSIYIVFWGVNNENKNRSEGYS